MRKVYKLEIERKSEQAEAWFWLLTLLTLIIVPAIFISVIPATPWLGMVVAIALVGLVIAVGLRACWLSSKVARVERQLEEAFPLAMFLPKPLRLSSRTMSESTIGPPDADGARIRMKEFSFKERPHS